MDNIKSKPRLTRDSVLLITGGAKGITARCAIRLAEVAGCKFILAGRSAVEEKDPAWAAGVSAPDDLQKAALTSFKELGEKITPKELQRAVADVLSSREVRETLVAIELHGGQAVYISVDVTDEKALAEQVQLAEKQLGSVTGVIHGAGNLADKLIENKTENDFNLVVNTKVKGLRSVIRSIDTQKLDFLVLFSSVAGFFGNAGQSDYALANEVLNKSAYILSKSLPNCRVISINWGPWDSGMVSPQLKKYFESRNIPLINTEEGVETLVNEITNENTSVPQVIVGSPIFGEHEVNVNNGRPITIHRTITLEENPFAQDHKIGPNPVLPATCASSWLVNTCEASFPGWHFRRMEDFKVLKGVTFSDEPQDYEIKLEKTESRDGELKLDASVTSLNEKGRRIFRYSGSVILSRNIPPAPIHKDIGFANLKTIDGRRLYENGTLFHGPLFQGVQEVAFDGKEKVVSRVMLPLMDIQSQGQFLAGPANPYINDAIVQSLLIWSQEIYGAPCLPSRLREWVQYRSIPFGITAWAVLSVIFHSEHAVSGDILVVGEDGREYFQYHGLEGTISQQLNRFIGRKAIPSKEG